MNRIWKYKWGSIQGRRGELGQRNNGHLTSLVGQLPHHPPVRRRRRSGIKGLVRHRRGQRCCLRAGGAAQTKRYSTRPPARPATGPGGSERAWKKEQFRRSRRSSSGLARGVFCDGREEGEKEASQSETSKSSHCSERKPYER